MAGGYARLTGRTGRAHVKQSEDRGTCRCSQGEGQVPRVANWEKLSGRARWSPCRAQLPSSNQPEAAEGDKEHCQEARCAASTWLPASWQKRCRSEAREARNRARSLVGSNSSEARKCALCRQKAMPSLPSPVQPGPWAPCSCPWEGMGRAHPLGSTHL